MKLNEYAVCKNVARKADGVYGFDNFEIDGVEVFSAIKYCGAARFEYLTGRKDGKLYVTIDRHMPEWPYLIHLFDYEGEDNMEDALRQCSKCLWQAVEDWENFSMAMDAIDWIFTR